MLNHLNATVPGRTKNIFRQWLNFGKATGLAIFFISGFAGCQTAEYADIGLAKELKSDMLALHEGDSVKVTFPGAPSLNTTQIIRRDGRISLPLIGEYKAAGMTTDLMEKELIALYGPQLQTKEVNVSIESSAFRIYVMGAVLRPGKLMSDRPMTALEAIMEAGGFDYAKANQKSVRVTRRENGQTEHFTLNLKDVLKGGEPDSFELKPGDIVYVPERFIWF
jgi:polysaccharide export outer membrane protein